MNRALSFSDDMFAKPSAWQIEARQHISLKSYIELPKEQEVDDLLSFAEACVELAQEIKPGTLVVFGQSLFGNCIPQYALPILEDVSGYKHGADFWIGLRHDRKIAFLGEGSFPLQMFAERHSQITMELVFDFVALEQRCVADKWQQLSKVSPNYLLRALYERGVTNADSKILVQGTLLQDSYGALRSQRIQALANLVELYPNVEVHDPYLKDESDLNAMGLCLTQNFSGNYDVVLHISDEPIFRFYDADFYEGICAVKPVIINLTPSL